MQMLTAADLHLLCRILDESGMSPQSCQTNGRNTRLPVHDVVYSNLDVTQEKRTLLLPRPPISTIRIIQSS
ncbi:hypothetical protein AGIG_G3712 [Arapaima gigas]